MSRIDYKRIDVQDFLEELSIRNVRDEGSEVMYSCPFPGHDHGDKNPSASMEKGTTRAHCFGCGWTGNALTFLAQYEGISPIEAARYIRQRFGDDFMEIQGSFRGEIDAILAGKPDERQENPILDESECERREVDWDNVDIPWMMEEEVPGPFKYMLDRGFSPEILTEFQVGWDHISQRITLPARDEEGRLVGFKARAWDPQQEPRYLVLGGPEYGFEPYDVSRVLFGLDKALSSWQYMQTRKLIVTEGELNAISAHQKEFRNTVGFSGRKLSTIQRNLLRKYADGITVITDDMEDSVRIAEQLEPYMKVSVVPPHEHDPADMSAEEFDTLVLNAMTGLEWTLRQINVLSST